jgi:hypothetical protein
MGACAEAISFCPSSVGRGAWANDGQTAVALVVFAVIAALGSACPGDRLLAGGERVQDTHGVAQLDGPRERDGDGFHRHSHPAGLIGDASVA